MKKYLVEVRTIKYIDMAIPTAMIMDKKTYIIQEIISEEYRVFLLAAALGRNTRLSSVKWKN